MWKRAAHLSTNKLTLSNANWAFPANDVTAASEDNKKCMFFYFEIKHFARRKRIFRLMTKEFL